MKKLVSLLLVVVLLIPVFAISEEGDISVDEVVEEVILDENGNEPDPGSEGDESVLDSEGNELIYDEETGETFIISDLSEEAQEKIEELDETIDDSVDPDTLEINPNLPDDVVNILLIGVDTHDPVEKDENTGEVVHRNIVGLADTQIIVSVNKKTGEIKMTSILRDSYVPIPGYKNKQKINVSFQFGCNKVKNGILDDKTPSGAALTMRTINHNFEMNIQHCVAINFSGLSGIIDVLGGIDIDMTKAEAKAVNSYLNMAYKIPSKFTYDPTYNPKTRKSTREPLEAVSGIHHCDGIQALTYARLRKIDNDFARTDRQRHLLDLLLGSVIKDMDLDKMMDLLDICTQYAYTNINMQTFFDLGMTVLGSGIVSRLGSGEALFESLRIPMERNYSYKTVGGSSVLSYNLTRHTRAIHEFIYGEYYPAD